MSRRIWPRGGYESGWCLTGEHGRCRMEHGAQAGACHCETCTAALNTAAAPPAHEPGAAAAPPSVPAEVGTSYNVAPDTDAITILGLATARLERIVDLHGAARDGVCRACGAAYPCTTRQLALGHVAGNRRAA